MPGTPSTTTGRFKTWDLDASLYSHQEYTDNWNALDALIGVAFTNARPLYNEIAALKQEREPLGVVKWWYRFGTNYSPPTGYVICDGGQIGANDFRDNSGNTLATTTPMPDLRGKFIIGANSALADAAAWTQGNAVTNAPGIRGTGGSNAAVAVNTTIPDHYHEFSHTHQTGPVTTSDPYETGAVPTGVGMIVGLSASAVGGSAGQAGNQSHKHNISIYASKPRLDDNHDQKLTEVVTNTSAAERLVTSKQYIATGGTAFAPTGGAAGDTTSVSVSVDARPAAIGFLPIMKVRYTTVA